MDENLSFYSTIDHGYNCHQLKFHLGGPPCSCTPTMAHDHWWDAPIPSWLWQSPEYIGITPYNDWWTLMNHKFALMDHQIHQLYPHFHRSRLIVGWFFQLSTAFNDPKILHPWPWPLKNPLFHGPRWPPFRISSQWADTELLSPRKSIRVPSSAGPCTGGKVSEDTEVRMVAGAVEELQGTWRDWIVKMEI